MYQVFRKIKGLNINLCQCPFCVRTPEWVEVPGNDYIMRCSSCHASTKKARWTPEEAAADWNANDIDDDHFTITSDTPIDEYLAAGIKKVLFSEYSNIDAYPQVESGFLCSEVVIITEKIMLIVEPVSTYLLYDEIGGYGHDLFKRYIASGDIEITFAKSKWKKGMLKSISFHFGPSVITVIPDLENDCMRVISRQKQG